MCEITVFHGSDHMVQTPVFQGGKADNDYGNGFYTTEYEDRARSWAVLNGRPESSIVNVYHLDLGKLEVLDLSEHGVLAWIAEVVANRGTNQEAADIVGKRLVERYKLDTQRYDIIKGYRADDSYTQVIEAFLLNQINIAEVERLFYKGSLGNQIFLKSETAFKNIKWMNAYEAEAKQTDRNDDLQARRQVNQFLSKRMEAILLEGYQVPGITARYAIQNRLQYQKKAGHMKMTAYDECYLNGMLQKSRYLFKLIARNCEDVFRVITDYLNSDCRKYMDAGNPLYLNKTPKQILGSMGIIIMPDVPISEQYDEFKLEWMADIYTFLQWKYNLSSKEIVNKVTPEDLYNKYSPLHETSLENGTEKLRRIYGL